MEKKLPEALAQIITAWPGSSPVKLMFQDEARFGRINDVRRCWAPFPVRPLCHGMLTHEYTYAYGAVDVVTGEFDSLILPHVNTGQTARWPPGGSAARAAARPLAL